MLIFFLNPFEIIRKKKFSNLDRIFEKINFHRSQYQNDISYRRWYFEMSKFFYFTKKIEKK